MSTTIQHFINGQRSSLASTRTADVFNPSTGEVQAQVLLASAADVDVAVGVAVKDTAKENDSGIATASSPQ